MFGGRYYEVNLEKNKFIHHNHKTEERYDNNKTHPDAYCVHKDTDMDMCKTECIYLEMYKRCRYLHYFQTTFSPKDNFLPN